MNNHKENYQEPDEEPKEGSSQQGRRKRPLQYDDLIQPGLELFRQAKKKFDGRMLVYALWIFIITLISMGLSPLTAKVLSQWMLPGLAYFLSAALHGALALSVHSLVIAIALHDIQKKKLWMGAVGLCLIVLTGLAIRRAVMLTADGSSAAWFTSWGLFFFELTIPVVLGYVLAQAEMAKTEAAEGKSFYGDHKGNLETGNPERVWNDAITSLDEEIDEVEETLERARPDKKHQLERKLNCLKQRLKTIKRWDPTQDYRPRPKKKRDDDSGNNEPDAGVLQPIRQ